MENLLIGCGAGFSGDRLDAAPPVVKTLIRRGQPSVLIYENLAERTLAFAQIAKSVDAEAGYEPLLALELAPVLGDCLAHGITIVGNFGAANPHAAANRIKALATELKLPEPRIAVVTGDEVDIGRGLKAVNELLSSGIRKESVVSANAYMGAWAIAEAIRAGAQIVVTGRVADPALTLGPAIAHYGWAEDDYDRLAGASIAGHLLECGSQVTGGYFSDPGKKDVPDMANLGFPIAEVFQDGHCVITKADNTGGMVDMRTVKEQLIYEIHDPAHFLTPDVVVDITNLKLEQIGKDAVAVTGVLGKTRPETLKTNVYYQDGWYGEAEISYAGRNAEARARLAMGVIKQRMNDDLHLRFDLIGALSIAADDAGWLMAATEPGEATDVRLRVASNHADEALVDSLLRELNALYNNGPAGGGGVRFNKRRRVSMKTCFIPRGDLVQHFQLLWK